MDWIYDDGGRAAAGFKGSADDCGVRAVAIALELPYRQVYADLGGNQAAWLATRRKQRAGGRSPRYGVWPEVLDRFVRSHGWDWTPTMSIGSGTRVHLRADELPPGRLIARCSKHYVAVVDGVVHDTFDPGRGGTRAVYGHWRPVT